MNRRRLLTGGLATIVVAVGAAHSPMSALDSPFLGASPRRTLGALFEVMLPDPAAAERLADGVDAFLITEDPLLSADLRMALVALEHGGLVRFSRLSPEGRTRRLKAWETSPVGVKRQIVQALRKVAMFTFYADPASWEAIGYEGPWV